MIRKLSYEDSDLYIDHIKRVYHEKGLLAENDEKWVETGLPEQSEDPQWLLQQPWFHAWGKFDNDKIVQSISCLYLVTTHTVAIRNYKSELKGIFKPSKDLSPLLDCLMTYFESLGVFNFHLVRRVDFFEWRRNLFFEDIPPLNRYNCYFEEIIPAGEVSKVEAHRFLANQNIFKYETAVATMSLKQELRKYGENKDRIHIPNTKEMYFKNQNK